MVPITYRTCWIVGWVVDKRIQKTCDGSKTPLSVAVSMRLVKRGVDGSIKTQTSLVVLRCSRVAMPADQAKLCDVASDSLCEPQPKAV